MKKMIWAAVVLLALATSTGPAWPGLGEDVAAQAGKLPAGGVPVFQVDPSW